MAGFNNIGLLFTLVVLCTVSAEIKKPEIIGTEKLSYSVVTSEMIVPGFEFIVHVNLFDVVNSTLYKGKPETKPVKDLEYAEFPSMDHSINLNITIEGLVSYYHNLQLTVGAEPKNFSEVIRFVVPHSMEISESVPKSKDDFNTPPRSRLVSIRATNNFHLQHSFRLPVVEGKVHPVIITDKVSYMKGETVRLAVLSHYSDMRPFKGPLNITLTNPLGMEVVELRFERSPNGIIIRDILMGKMFVSGLYNLTLSVRGEIVTKTILLTEEIKKNFDVKLAVSSHIAVKVTDESKSNNIKWVLEAFYPSGTPVKGMVKPRIMLRNSTLPLKWVESGPIPLKNGLCLGDLPISLLMKKLNYNGKLAHTVLDVQLEVIEEREEWHLGDHPSSGVTGLPATVTLPSGTLPTGTGSMPTGTGSMTTGPLPTGTGSMTTGPMMTGSSETIPLSTGSQMPSEKLIDSRRIVTVNTSIIFTDEPLTLDFTDFTPSVFRREQKFIGYINLMALDTTAHAYQYMSLTKELREKLEKGEQLNHLTEMLKLVPHAPLTIDYLKLREVEIKVKHFSTMPKTLPVSATETPIHEETIKLSVLPSVVKSFEFMGHPKSSRVEIEATYKDPDTEKIVRIVKDDVIVYESNSGKFESIQMRLNMEKPSVTHGEELKTKLTCSFPIKSVFYEIYNDQVLVMSGSRTFGKLDKMQELNILLSGSETRLLSPVSRLLVWTPTPEDDIITESLFFVFETRPLIRTRLEVSQTELTMNRTVTAVLHGQPNSNVLIFASQDPLLMATPKTEGPYSLERILKTLTKERVNHLAKKLKYTLMHTGHSRTPLLNSLSLPSVYTQKSIRPFETLPGSSCLNSALLFPSTLLLNSYTSLPSLEHDSWRILKASRSMMLTDGTIFKSPLEPTPRMKSVDRLRLIRSRNLLKDMTVEEQLESYLRNLDKLPMQDSTVPTLSYMRLVTIPESGVLSYTMELPAIRRVCSIQAMTIHSEHGIDILDEPVMISVRPSVLTTVMNPEVVVEGEEFALEVKLSNTDSKPITVEVMIREQEDFRVVCKGEQITPLPKDPKNHPTLKSKKEFKSETIKIEAGETVEHKFYIETLVRSDRFEETEIKVPVLVILEKMPHLTTASFRILPMGLTETTTKGRLIELTKQTREYSIPLELKPTPLPLENTRKTVLLYRDVLAPALESMCSRHFNFSLTNEIDWASYKIALYGVNHVLDSMRNDSLIEGNKWERILNRLNRSIDMESSIELQMLNLRRITCLKKVVESTQSYFKSDAKMTRETPRSIWMGLQILEGMSEWWEVADISMTLPTTTIEMILSMQKPSGHFEEDVKAPVILGEFAPNSASKNVPLTAQAIIILTKCKENIPLSKELLSKISICIEKATKYIESQLTVPEVIQNTFTLNIATHALILANSPKLFIATGLRDSRRIEREHETFWLYKETEVKEQTTHSSHSIMATSYAALSHLRSGDLESATPICNWLLSQMDRSGRFIGSKDTSLALEVLTLYTKMMNRKNRVSLSHTIVTIPHKDKTLTLTFQSTETILDLTEIIMRELKEMPTPLKIMVQGRGLVVLHEITEMKTLSPKDKETSESVTLKVTTSKKSDLFDLVNICVTPTKPSPGEFIIVTVPILSGHVFDWKTNEVTLKKHALFSQMKTNGTVQIVTLNVESIKATCLDLLLEISQRVGNIQPRLITASTYAEMRMPSMVSYSESHHKHEVENICPTCTCTTIPFERSNPFYPKVL